MQLGGRQKFLIDISSFEYTSGKEAKELDGYKIFVYSPIMMVYEKLRAICQQMPEYGQIVNRGRPGATRARDFLDIHELIVSFNLNVAAPQNLELLANIFSAKRVPLKFLGAIENFRDFHRIDFQSVKDTLKPGTQIMEFDFYFDYVLSIVKELKPFWDE